MNRDDIISMARECGLTINQRLMLGVEHFAELVADAERKQCYDLIDTLVKAEREMCARVCEGDGVRQMNGDECAAAIRARGE